MNVNAQMPNDLESLWMPFTASRWFKGAPRLLAGAEGLHYTAVDGSRIFDGTGGLWCCNAGHGVRRITEAIQAQAAQLDFAHNFNLGHPIAFQAASRMVELAEGFETVFFTNSGSEAVDTALKIALAYHHARGDGQRRILVGREGAYHGVNFGGLAVAGIGRNKEQFGTLYPNAHHMRHTKLPENAKSRGEPAMGAHLADDLQHICNVHGGGNVAAAIVEPVMGAGGVYPPPQGYLKRLREICDAHGILLIFDEVICGFGRLGRAFGYQHFEVMPDMITAAKGMTNATVPMGGVFCREGLREAMLTGPDAKPDLFHGYTYSGHPLACAAAIATLDTYRDEGIFENAARMAPLWEDMLHGLAAKPGVTDVRNLGLLGAIELAPEGGPGARARHLFEHLWDQGLMVRPAGEAIVMSPPLTIDAASIEWVGETIGRALDG